MGGLLAPPPPPPPEDPAHRRSLLVDGLHKFVERCLALLRSKKREPKLRGGFWKLLRDLSSSEALAAAARAVLRELPGVLRSQPPPPDLVGDEGARNASGEPRSREDILHERRGYEAIRMYVLSATV